MSDLLGLLPRYGYAVVFGVILLENLGLPLPGIAVLIVAGALAGAGKLSLAGVIALSVAGALIGDLVWYALGRWRGRSVLGLLCRLSLNPDTCVGSTERFFLRHGMRTLLIAKFVPGLNTIAPPLMGTLRARFGRFLGYDLGGALLLSGVGAGVGYLLGAEVADRAEVVLAPLGAWAGWSLVALGLGYVAWRLVVRLRTRRALRTVGLSPAELKRRLEAGHAITVVDVRSPLAIGEEPHRLPGAVHVPHDEIHHAAAGWPRDRRIVAYCV